MKKEIKEFAEEMEKVMQRQDKAKGNSWRICAIDYLEGKRAEEHREYNRSGDVKELIDEANILMMLWHRRKGHEKMGRH